MSRLLLPQVDHLRSLRLSWVGWAGSVMAPKHKAGKTLQDVCLELVLNSIRVPRLSSQLMRVNPEAKPSVSAVIVTSTGRYLISATRFELWKDQICYPLSTSSSWSLLWSLSFNHTHYSNINLGDNLNVNLNPSHSPNLIFRFRFKLKVQKTTLIRKWLGSADLCSLKFIQESRRTIQVWE